jgi:hypothetical protein
MTQALTQARKALEAIVDTLDAEEMGEGPPASLHVAHWQKLHEDAQSALAAIDAALEGGAVPKVKALVWKEARISDQWERFSAECVFGCYEVLEWSDGGFGGTLPGSLTEFDADSIEAAKAAAQADYERRIRSAIVLGDDDDAQ